MSAAAASEPPPCRFRVQWIDGGRVAQEPPNPNYPDGLDFDAAGAGQPCVKVELPYPAPRCGHHLVTCETCATSLLITAAGRRDAPPRCASPARANEPFARASGRRAREPA